MKNKGKKEKKVQSSLFFRVKRKRYAAPTSNLKRSSEPGPGCFKHCEQMTTFHQQATQLRPEVPTA
jgi:hypothetical protein